MESERMKMEAPASSFYRHKEERSTCTGNLRSRRLPGNRGCAVVDHCLKYIVEYWGVWRRAWQCPGRLFGLAEIARGVLLTSVGVVVSFVGGTVLWA